MPQLIVVTRAGEESTVEVQDGLTVMEAIRDNGFESPFNRGPFYACRDHEGALARQAVSMVPKLELTVCPCMVS